MNRKEFEKLYPNIKVTETEVYPCEHKWISVKYRLPEKIDKVLVFTKWPLEYLEIVPQKYEIRFGCYNKKSESWEILHNIYDLEITHWMPLPSLPEEKC